MSRVLELIEASDLVIKTDLVPATAGEVLSNPKLLDEMFPKSSDLIEFLKEQVLKEAMRGQAHVHRPTKKAAKKVAVKRPTTSDAIAATAQAMAEAEGDGEG